MKYEGETFTSEVELDGNEFNNCTFRGNVLIYRGGQPPSLRNCSFEDPEFRFLDAAGNTIAFLQAMARADSGLQSVVRDTFPAIFGN